MMIKSPIQYFGGKQGMVKNLLPLIPAHQTYVEVFGGGGSLILYKEPSPVDVYNDLDSNLVNFFRVLRDPVQFADFYQRAWLSPYSREEQSFCREHLNDDLDPVERARRFFVLARYSFSGIIGNSFALEVTKSSRGIVGKASAYKNVLCWLPIISERLSSIEIEHYDFRRILDIYDRPETFFYCDPPYVPSTRRAGGYQCEMTETDHQDLVELLRNIRGKVMLSGYPNELYETLGWQRKEWTVNCSAAARTRASGLQGAGGASGQKRVECVWMNYEVDT